jgi:phosphoglycolate phosphatase-like HAD superfamily hydrolase
MLRLASVALSMKNANIFVDVDLTLVDANGKLLPSARDGLVRLKDKGCHLFLWSTGGAEYCRKVANLYGLTELFEGFSAKPDIVIDDMPSTCVAPFVYNVHDERSWTVLADTIIAKHID